MIDEQLRRALDRRRQKGILRGLKRFTTIHDAVRPAASQTSAAPHRDYPATTPLSDFSSNDYMGLARSTEMQNSIIRKMQTSTRFTLGSTGSRLLDGNSVEHEALEHRLAEHFVSSSALLFNSGYDANTSLLSVLPQPGDIVLYDELAHASMHDGMRASRIDAPHRIAFSHNDLNDLAFRLDEALQADTTKQANVFVAVEAVYSMDGDTCPIRQLAAIVDARVPRERRCIIVDEAHAVGLYGLNGAGLCEAMGVRDLVDVRLITFGKAFGCSGAAVLCSAIVRLYLINYARPLIYSTAIAHPSLLAINAALDILSTPAGAMRASQTFTLTQTFIDQLQAVLARASRAGQRLTISLPADVQQRIGIDDHGTHEVNAARQKLAVPPPPIVPIVTPKARELADVLTQNGFLVRPIAYPTVPIGLERVRICIHAHNSHEEVVSLVRCIERWIQSHAADNSVNRDLHAASSASLHSSTTSDVEKAKL